MQNTSTPIDTEQFVRAVADALRPSLGPEIKADASMSLRDMRTQSKTHFSSIDWALIPSYGGLLVSVATMLHGFWLARKQSKKVDGQEILSWLLERDQSISLILEDEKKRLVVTTVCEHAATKVNCSLAAE